MKNERDDVHEREGKRKSQRWHSGGMPGDYFVARGIALEHERKREGDRWREGRGEERTKSNKRLCFDLAW